MYYKITAEEFALFSATPHLFPNLPPTKETIPFLKRNNLRKAKPTLISIPPTNNPLEQSIPFVPNISYLNRTFGSLVITNQD